MRDIGLHFSRFRSKRLKLDKNEGGEGWLHLVEEGFEF